MTRAIRRQLRAIEHAVASACLVLGLGGCPNASLPRATPTAAELQAFQNDSGLTLPSSTQVLAVVRDTRQSNKSADYLMYSPTPLDFATLAPPGAVSEVPFGGWSADDSDQAAQGVKDAMRGLRKIEDVLSVKHFAWDNCNRQFWALLVQDANGYYALVQDAGPR